MLDVKDAKEIKVSSCILILKIVKLGLQKIYYWTNVITKWKNDYKTNRNNRTYLISQ